MVINSCCHQICLAQFALESNKIFMFAYTGTHYGQVSMDALNRINEYSKSKFFWHNGVGVGVRIYGYQPKYTTNNNHEGTLSFSYVGSFNNVVETPAQPDVLQTERISIQTLGLQFLHKKWMNKYYLNMGFKLNYGWRSVKSEFSYVPTGEFWIPPSSYHSSVYGIAPIVQIEYPLPKRNFGLFAGIQMEIMRFNCDVLYHGSFGSILENCVAAWPMISGGVVYRFSRVKGKL